LEFRRVLFRSLDHLQWLLLTQRVVAFPHLVEKDIDVHNQLNLQDAMIPSLSLCAHFFQFLGFLIHIQCSIRLFYAETMRSFETPSLFFHVVQFAVFLYSSEQYLHRQSKYDLMSVQLTDLIIELMLTFHFQKAP